MDKRKYKTVIKPFNKSAHSEIRSFFKLFAYSVSEFKSVKLRGKNGELLRDKYGLVKTRKTKPYFSLYLIGNLNRRTVQSISARINRKHRKHAESIGS